MASCGGITIENPPSPPFDPLSGATVAAGTVVVVDVAGIVVVVELLGTVVVVDVPRIVVGEGPHGIVVVEVVVVDRDVVVAVVEGDVVVVVVVVVDGAGCVVVVVVVLVVVVVGTGPEYSTDWTSEMAASLEALSSCKAATAASYTGSDAAAFVVAVALVVVLIVLAVVLVNREDAARAADDARIAILAEGTLSAAASVENASSQTVLAVTLASADNQINQDIVAAATSALRQTSAELTRRFDILVSELTPSERASATEALNKLDAETRVFVATSLNGDVDAVAATSSDSNAAYNDLVTELVGLRDEHVQSVLLAGRELGRVADAVRFLVFFLVPLMLIIVYRRGARRREDARRLGEALTSERALAQSRDDFIADLSHELRTPLTGIYGFALALGDSQSLGDEDREFAKHIVSEAAELNRMVCDLITTGRIAAGTLAMSTEDLRLEPAVTEVANVFAMRGIAVGVRVPEVIVRADRMGLRQLILNLVSNAARHGGDETSVEAVMREGAVLMRVIDDGPGVPEDIEPYLFNRYLHGGGRALLSGSVGLGTAVAAAYAESFGGTIEYIRTSDRTIFEVRLPVVVSHAEPALV